MKRRSALAGIGLISGTALIAYSGYKWLEWNRKPELSNLPERGGLIASLVDTIIPDTDTPGARAAGVHDFVIKMVTYCTEVKTQNKFIDGLNEIESYSIKEFGRSFEICSMNERIEILGYFEKRDKLFPGLVGKAQARYLGKPFFYTIKEYSSIGYFTSKIGATQALRYSLVPSKYLACIPYLPKEKGWATY